MFYFFFDWPLLPIFIIVIGCGYQIERLKASLFILFYTLFASLPLLVLIIIIITTSQVSLIYIYRSLSNIARGHTLPSLMLIGAFLVKFPMFFVHQWLLKLGGYGIIRVSALLRPCGALEGVLILALLGG